MIHKMIPFDIGGPLDLLLRVDKITGILPPTSKNKKTTTILHHNGNFEVNENYLEVVVKYYELVEEDEEIEE